MRDYPRENPAAKHHDRLGAVGWTVSGSNDMHALSCSPRMNVSASLLLVHQAAGSTTDHVQTTDEVVMAEKGFRG